jgi:hypothetical protein
MIPLSRDSWLAIGLFILLLLITVIAAIQQTQAEVAPALASFSAKPDGAKALWLWLEELGYPVSQATPAIYQPPEDAGLIFLLEPSAGFTAEEWRELDGWVEEGGLLVLAGEGLGTALAARHYDFNLAYLTPVTATLAPQTPLWTSPPITPANIQARAYFETGRRDFVTHLAVEHQPVILSFERGDGRVLLSAAPYPFSNAGLKEAGNPALVLNIVSAAPRSGLVWFDEWHHGVRSNRTELAGPFDWLRYTPAGRSLLYLAAVVFIAIILRGQHFGRPIPLPRETGRRAPLEYITAIANLSRRARHRSAVLRQYHHWLKRGLGQPYRLNPGLPDADYLAQLSRFNPALDTAALGSLLTRLRQEQVSENELIRLAGEVAVWLKEK